MLLRAGANFCLQESSKALIYASKFGDEKVLEMLLKAGADSDLQTEDGETSLIFASKNGFVEIVEKLLRVGANPISEDKTKDLDLWFNNPFNLFEYLEDDMKFYNVSNYEDTEIQSTDYEYYDLAAEMGCTDGELEDWFESAYERYG